MPSVAEIAAAKEFIHPKDAPILAAAMSLEVDYLVTLNRKHFLDDPEVARKSGLRIGTPGDFLAWFRKRLE
jgi:predicted nucleic acid-binding protein